MSIAVPLEALAHEVAARQFAYLLTVDDEGRARVLALVPECVDGVLRFHVGSERAAERVRRRPQVSLVFPPCASDVMSLVVDGDAVVDGEVVVVRPTWAVRHRPAPGSGAPDHSPV
jgi:hypothetical protein